jgi:hypothetical protein
VPPEFWYDRPSSYTVLCLPIIEWSFRFQRPQQLMRQLAARGHRVLYAANRFHRGSEVRLHPLETGIVEFALPGDSATNVYQQLPSMEQAGRMTKALVALAGTTGLRETVIVAQLPFWTALAENLRAQLGWPIVYDCMDAHGGFLNNTPAVLDEEARLIATADLVIASSDRLEESVRDRSRRALLVRNGCEYDHFHSVCDFSAPTAPRPVVGYYGAIGDWFDSNLVAELAAWRHDWDFELIGGNPRGRRSQPRGAIKHPVTWRMPVSRASKEDPALERLYHSIQARIIDGCDKPSEGIRDAGDGEARRGRTSSRA